MRGAGTWTVQCWRPEKKAQQYEGSEKKRGKRGKDKEGSQRATEIDGQGIPSANK